ncbi:ATP-binding protein [Arcticibacter eurypsychrophilus]|uniref:ATP-binding protein n=1 Tax=Arcticibacter eurypsychrophilus TaxID=1434752 RepID=UPI00084D3B39|nr:AAA family ATPase [Arcticibacter eurypsychrophilus]
MYLPRKIDQELVLWRNEKEGKPLLIRGARQVGKSTAIRELAKQFDFYLEVNFEEQRRVHRLFEGDLNPKELCENLSILYNIPIIPGKTLLFFDEIQACIPAISSLRFFYEKYQELHVIAAGSLLEFALAEIPSFGVGRIRSLFVYPLSFDEYLTGTGELQLLAAKKKATFEKPLTEPIHQKLLNHVKRFLILGGMPEVVASYVEHQDINRCGQVLDDLITSLKADFAKYKKQVPFLRISEVFDSVVGQSGGKFIYTKAATEANHKQIKEAVDLLVMSGLIIPVTHTAANGLPLGAEANPKKRKMLLLDTGIFQRLRGLQITDILFEDDFDTINKGAIAEQYVGLELLKSSSCYRQENLYFWHREAKSSNAEVDYVIQQKDNIVPIEVKSGKKGSMQSLFVFMKEKKSLKGVRFSLENYSSYAKIQVFPIYAVAEAVS